MCGIAGFFGAPGPYDRGALLRMLGTMPHRGPDDEGVWADAQGRCLLGHRRLSIIDTSAAGHQPMAGADGRWVISFNGELYNFQELRPRLEAEGVRFNGRTDTEVLVAALAQWGTGALERLDGMFAFAAFDTHSGELLLARDPFGEKPLYYCALPGGGTAFASELQALETLPGFDAEASLDAIGELLMFQYIGAPRTIYRNVQKLPPGHWLRLRPGSAPETGRYFTFDAAVEPYDARPLADLADEAEALLVQSLRRRMIADVPLGAFLSGGVDSSTVCALVRQKLKLPLSTFTIGFRGAEDTEHVAARQFADHLGTAHHEQILDPTAGDFLLNIGAVLDEPNGDTSCLPTYLLSQFARRHVTVAVSGDGGDELFCGYDRYFATLADGSADAYYAGRILISRDAQVAALLGGMPAGTQALLDRLRGEVRAGKGPLHARLRNTDVANYLPGAVLPKVDRMSMRHSLEVRTPFLNTDLARFAARLPAQMLAQGSRGKVVLREIARRYLPAALVEAPKRGFGLPTTLWGKEEQLRVADILLLGPESRLRAAFGDRALDGLLAAQRSMSGYEPYRLWAVAMLESWCRHHPVKLPQLAPAGQPRARSHVPEQAEAPLHQRAIALLPPRAQFILRRAVDGARIERRLRGNAAALLWLIGRSALALGRLFLYPFRRALQRVAQGRLARLIEARIGGLADIAGRPLRPGDRVVLVSHDLAGGGAQRQWCYLAHGLKDRGYDVTFLLLKEPVGPDGHYLDYLRQLGIEPVHLAQAAPEAAGFEALAALCTQAGLGPDPARMAARLKALRPAAVFSALDTPNIASGIAGIFAAVPRVVLSFRNYNPSRFSYLDNEWHLPLYRALCAAPNIVLSGNSPDANADYARWLGIDEQRVHCIPNALSAEFFPAPARGAQDRLRRQLAIGEAQPVVLGVFRLSEEKQPLLFVDVCARILAARPDARILHAGVGHEEAAIQRALRERGLEGRITFLGPRSDMPALMGIATLLLLTSSLEGMPNVVMEAQFAGLPVVATNAGATAACLADGVSGLLAGTGDAPALADACLRILGDPALARRMGEAGAQRARSEFSPARMIDRYLGVLGHGRSDAARLRGQAA
jgi:asparagine synthase (glutamine-hydrolysing)